MDDSIISSTKLVNEIINENVKLKIKLKELEVKFETSKSDDNANNNNDVSNENIIRERNILIDKLKLRIKNMDDTVKEKDNIINTQKLELSKYKNIIMQNNRTVLGVFNNSINNYTEDLSYRKTLINDITRQIKEQKTRILNFNEEIELLRDDINKHYN